jgi:alkanesulfonate monooxygenase SsuD/methylene tetrahydromethanopterin reductase-like flavin-dependent oxidoreductase (luciferase family)
LRKLGKNPGTESYRVKPHRPRRPGRVFETVRREIFHQALSPALQCLGHQNVTELGENARSPAQVDADHFIIGDAAECIDKIAGYAALGLKEVACLMNFGTPDAAAVERSMRLFAERVMPHLGSN